MTKVTRRLVYPVRSLELLALLTLGLAVVIVLLVAAFDALRDARGTDTALLVFGGGAAALLLLGGIAFAAMHHRAPGHTAHRTETGRGGRTLEVASPDGTILHVEVEGPEDAEVTVVFCHGWIVDLTTWQRQRDALADSDVRRVFWDQRGHGRSQWIGLDPGERGVRQLADDLAAVIEATAPTGRLVLAGHSMGGMTLMAFAQRHLPTVRGRVDGVLLVATGAGPLSEQMTLGLPRGFLLGHALVRRYAVSTIALLGLLPRPVARLLGVGPWLISARLLAVAPDASAQAVAVTTGAMWRNHLHIAAMTLRAVMTHDERQDVPALACTRTVTVMPGRDRLIPVRFQRELAAMVADSGAVEVPRSGHMVMLEAPEVVTNEVVALTLHATQRAAALRAG